MFVFTSPGGWIEVLPSSNQNQGQAPKAAPHARAGLLPDGQQALVLAQTEVTPEEAEVDAGVRASLGGRGRLRLLWGNTLFHADDVPYLPDMADLPDVFTPFRNKVSASAVSQPCFHFRRKAESAATKG